jgi:hypothetical protein
MSNAPTSEPPPKREDRRRWIRWAAVLVVVWAVAAYLLVPEAWYRYARRHPSLDDVPTITYTADDIPGDPLNIAAVATESEFKLLMLAAKWYPADPLTLKSCLEIAEATVLKRPYDEAPVSNLFLFHRKEDLAFEKPVGDDPRQRHHVRFWKTEKLDSDGRPYWIGSATYDRAVGLSHTTGQITHHIGADVDAERDGLIADWQATGRLIETYVVADFQKQHEGRNGGGDPWHTDGNLKVGVVRP